MKSIMKRIVSALALQQPEDESMPVETITFKQADDAAQVLHVLAAQAGGTYYQHEYALGSHRRVTIAILGFTAELDFTTTLATATFKTGGDALWSKEWASTFPDSIITSETISVEWWNSVKQALRIVRDRKAYYYKRTDNPYKRHGSL